MQDHSLLCDFLNLLVEDISRAAEFNEEGTVFYKSAQLRRYAGDTLQVLFPQTVQGSEQNGLAVTEGKT